MSADTNNQKKSNSETVPFNISKLSNLQYIKVIYIGSDKELYEINTDIVSISNEVIYLFLNTPKEIDFKCPVGIVLKLVTGDAIHFAKVILKEIKKVNNRILFIMDAPQKTIRQQNRKHCRININCPGVIIVDEKIGKQTYLTKTVNISMGGVLLSDIESLLNDDKISLQLGKEELCHIVLFIEQNFIVKLCAQFVRCECVDDSYRYAFQFINMPQKYINPLNKYITNEQIKLLKINNTKSLNRAAI